MKKNYRIRNCLAALMAAFILSVSLLTPALEVSAAKTATVSSESLYDIALAKVGIHANNSLLSRLVNSHINTLTGTAQSYWGFCKTEGLEKNAESWSAYVNSDSYATPVMRLASWIIQTDYFLKWCWNNDETDFLGSDLVNAVLGNDTALAGESYKLDDELVESIHDDFESFVQTDGIGYYYVPVYPATQLDVTWFNNIDSFNNMKSYIESVEFPTFMCMQYDKTSKISTVDVLDNSYWRNIVWSRKDGDGLNLYDDDWNRSSGIYRHNFALPVTINYYDTDSFIAERSSTMSYYSITMYNIPQSGKYSSIFRLYGKEAGKQIIFCSVDDMKAYLVGQRPYYVTTNNIYDNSVDNSVEVTGDYLVNNGGSLSYDTIYNQIQEGDVTTDNSINEIVNSNNQTIINNYYYTEDTGDSGSGDSGSGSFGDGIASFFEGLKSILDFLLGIIGDLATTVTSFLGSVYDLIKNIGGQFTGFSELLGELFVFIPQEIIDLLTAGIGVIIVVCIFKWLKG